MKKKHFYIGREFVTFLCLALLGVSWIVGVQAQQVSVANWAIEIVAQLAPDSLSVYLTAKDSKETGSIIEVPMSPYIKGLSSIVLVACGEEQAIGFIAGKLSSPGNRLIVIHIEMQNTEKDTISLRVGDISLIDADGRNLPYVAVSKNDSYLIAKTSIAAWRSSQEIVLSVEPDKKLKMSYCFLVPPKSTPVNLKLKENKIDISLDYNELSEYKIESPWIMELAGQFKLDFCLDSLEIDGYFATQDANIKFKADGISFPEDKYPDGVPFAVYMGSGGARSYNTRDIHEITNGKKSIRTLSSFYVFKNGLYLAGTISVLKDISPIEWVITFGEPTFKAVFKSYFQAKKGDILAAVGQVGLLGSILSVHTME